MQFRKGIYRKCIARNALPINFLTDFLCALPLATSQCDSEGDDDKVSLVAFTIAILFGLHFGCKFTDIAAIVVSAPYLLAQVLVSKPTNAS